VERNRFSLIHLKNVESDKKLMFYIGSLVELFESSKFEAIFELKVQSVRAIYVRTAICKVVLRKHKCKIFAIHCSYVAQVDNQSFKEFDMINIFTFINSQFKYLKSSSILKEK